MKLAVLSDLHYDATDTSDPTTTCGSERDTLLARAIHRLNHFIKPDLTLLLGDLLDDSEKPGAREQLATLRKITGLIESPSIIIPGNHDGPPDVFFSIFERPKEMVEIKGIRFLPFIDPEEPEYNARRAAEDLTRFAEARIDFGGPIVAVQHVPVFRPGESECPFNHTNAGEILDEMERHGVVLSLSGHFHGGMTLMHPDGVSSIVAPALCAPPFRFLEIEIDGREISVMTHSLNM